MTWADIKPGTALDVDGRIFIKTNHFALDALEVESGIIYDHKDILQDLSVENQVRFVTLLPMYYDPAV